MEKLLNKKSVIMALVAVAVGVIGYAFDVLEQISAILGG